MKTFCAFAVFLIALFAYASAIDESINAYDASYKPPAFEVDTSNDESHEDSGISEQNNISETRTADANNRNTIISSTITGLIGFVTGIFASLLSWLVIKRIRPKITISDKILLTPSVFQNEKLIPKIKIENSSRYDAFQVDLRGRIFMHGLEKDDSEKPKRFIVNVGSNAPHPYLPGKKKERNEKYGGREFSLRLNKSTQKKLATDTFMLEEGDVVTLTDCLLHNSLNYIEISVFSSHAFSFTTGMIKRIYKSGDLIEGCFENRGLGIQNKTSRKTDHQTNNHDIEESHNKDE